MIDLRDCVISCQRRQKEILSTGVIWPVIKGDGRVKCVSHCSFLAAGVKAMALELLLVFCPHYI